MCLSSPVCVCRLFLAFHKCIHAYSSILGRKFFRIGNDVLYDSQKFGTCTRQCIHTTYKTSNENKLTIKLRIRNNLLARKRNVFILFCCCCNFSLFSLSQNGFDDGKQYVQCTARIHNRFSSYQMFNVVVVVFFFSILTRD